nr:MAG TPA: FERM-like protein [Bacteriophage sp.]DAX32066.1 MAG TPA: FERM-like protein [Caudoviricetes sp.]
MLSEEALWLHQQMTMSRVSNTFLAQTQNP